MIVEDLPRFLVHTIFDAQFLGHGLPDARRQLLDGRRLDHFLGDQTLGHFLGHVGDVIAGEQHVIWLVYNENVESLLAAWKDVKEGGRRRYEMGTINRAGGIRDRTAHATNAKPSSRRDKVPYSGRSASQKRAHAIGSSAFHFKRLSAMVGGWRALSIFAAAGTAIRPGIAKINKFAPKHTARPTTSLPP